MANVLSHCEEHKAPSRTDQANSKVTAILDSGAIMHMFRTSVKGLNERLVTDGILVKTFSNDTRQAEAIDLLNLPDTDIEAAQYHKFPDHQVSDNILSIPQFAQSDCTTVMDQQRATVYNRNGKPILHGEFNTRTSSYTVDLIDQGLIPAPIFTDIHPSTI